MKNSMFLIFLEGVPKRKMKLVAVSLMPQSMAVTLQKKKMIVMKQLKKQVKNTFPNCLTR